MERKDNDYSFFLAIIAIWIMVGGMAQCKSATELDNIRHELHMMRHCN